jgi:hypothetical protein
MTPIVTPLLHETVAAAADAGAAGRAAAPTTTANAATVEAIATSAIFLNIKLPSFGVTPGKTPPQSFGLPRVRPVGTDLTRFRKIRVGTLLDL